MGRGKLDASWYVETKGSGYYLRRELRYLWRIDTVDGMRPKSGLNNILVQEYIGIYNRDVDMPYQTRVPRNAQTLKNVHERAFAETEDAGKP